MATNGTTATAQAKEHPLTEWGGAELVERYIERLPEPRTEAQKQAKAAIEAGRFDECKVLAVCHLEDNYIKAIGYLSSVEKVTDMGAPTLPTLVAEACRAIAETICDNSIEDEMMKPENRESDRRICLFDLNEMNQNIFRKALKGAA